MNMLLAALDTSSGGLIHLLIALVVAALIFWLIWWIIDWMGLPAPIGMVVRVLVGLIAILILLHFVGLF